MGLAIERVTGEDLTGRQRNFVRYFVEYRSPLKAYRMAYDNDNSPGWQISNRANELLKIPKIQDAISRLSAIEAERHQTSMQTILREWIMIAKADPNKLIRHRVANCRHCNGVDHQYQWNDVEEWAAAYAAVVEYNDTEDGRRSPKDPPGSDGGFGFNHTLAPDPECPKCRGDGVTDVVIADTKRLTGPEKALYRGTKVTKNGIEILMADKDKAIENIAKHFGMFIDRVAIGLDDPAADMKDITPKDPVEASRTYQRLIGS